MPISSVMHDDIIRPFQIQPFGLRGRLVRLGPAIDAILARHRYPPLVATLLAEAASLAAILAGALKYEGIFTLQTKSKGPVSLLMADVTSAGAIRAYAQFDKTEIQRLEALGGTVSLPKLMGVGYLAFTVDQGEHTERYQGIVELDGATLADCTHHYFRQSEQIEAGLRVAARQMPNGHWRAGGIMLQRMPPEGGEGVESRLSFEGEEAVAAQDDAWRAALLMLGSCSAKEMTDPTLGSDQLLFRLFHEDGVIVYPENALMDQCRCSRDKIEMVIRSLPADDLSEIQVNGEAAVTCEFCSTHYVFDMTQILAPREAPENDY